MAPAALEGRGRWQARLALLLALPVLLTGMYGTNYVFLAASEPYRCRVEECESWGNSSAGAGGEAAAGGEWAPDWAAWALPPGDACRRYAPRGSPGPPGPPGSPGCSPDSFDNSSTVPCTSFVYQTHNSIYSEFNLACQEWRRTLVGSAHNVGMLVSLPLMGVVSDRWGRRAALVASGLGAGLLGLLKSFSASYYVYLALELLETAMGASVYPAAFVLMIEWLGAAHRAEASLALGIPLSAGAACLAGLDWLVAGRGGWRLWARLAYPPSLLLLLYLWLLPESVRWLTAQGRREEASDLVKRAAKYNGAPVAEEALEKMLLSDAAPRDESIVRAFFKYGALRRRLVVCGVWWASGVFVFYGLAAGAHSLGGSRHGNYALLAAAELPALLLNTLLLPRGRRRLLAGSCLLTAAALVGMACLPDAGGALGVALYVGGKLGATMTLNALYVYTAELFPTRARQRLLAACSTCGRLGAVLAPLTPLLAAQYPWLPAALFGSLPLLSAALTPLLPDTLHAALPDSFADLARPGVAPGPE